LLPRAGLGAVVALCLCSAGVAQERPATADELQQKCFAGRTELEGLIGKLADADKRGMVILAVEEIAELEEDSAWSVCVALVEETLHKVK
jgi:hypothetical protein